MHTTVIKNGTRPSEAFEPEKLHQSILASCLSVRAPAGQAEDIAGRVTVGVMHWCHDRPEVTSSDIRRTAAKHLRPLHEDAAYIYEHDKSMM